MFVWYCSTALRRSVLTFHLAMDDFALSNPTQTAADLNTMASFLAAPDILDPLGLASAAPEGQDRVELLILLGNSVLYTLDVVAGALKEELVDRLLVVGGEGHSTSYLRRSVQRDSRYQDIDVNGKAEAEIFRDVLVEGHGFGTGSIRLESESKNCGENAEFAYREIQEWGALPEQIVLVQDPTMQRRTKATFQRVWGPQSNTQFFNFPPFVPAVEVEKGRLHFENPERPGLWSMERFVSLVMGEIPRLRNDENGYGPNGKGYIVEVDIPEGVENAYRRLQGPFDAYVRPVH